MITFPNAKLNLGLFITNKRTDGYHDLETIFYPIPCCHDALEINKSTKDSFQAVGLPISGDTSNNLVLKALSIIRRHHPEAATALDIHLLKKIPMGAGMGGGSANGSFMLTMLNQYFDLGNSQEQLAKYALELGSDCPFFIYNTPSFGSGRGEQLSPIELDLSAYSIQIICPDVHISTATAFSKVTPKAATFDLREINTLPIHKWQAHIHNDFEEGIFSTYPELAHIKEQFINQGALYAAMSGSGSTLFGIFPKEQKAQISSPLTFKEFYEK